MNKSKRKLSFGNPSPSDFKVHDYPFYLMNQVENRYYAVMDRVFEEDKVSRPIWRILLLLRHNEYASVTDISEHSAMQRPTVSRILERMEKQKLVERRERPDDNRVKEVFLLPKGKKIIEKVVNDVAMQYEWTVRGLKDSQLKTFNNVLHHMLENLKSFPWTE